MRVEEIVDRIHALFATRDNAHFQEESGVTHDAGLEVSHIGYATNLTVDVIEAAREMGVGLIVTHHDAWGFIGNLKETCMALLERYEISHYYNHLPLDDADFGTNASLAKAIGLTVIKRVNEENGFMCGLIGEFDEPLRFESVVKVCEECLAERVQAWKFHDRPIKRVHILCGAGHLTSDMAVSLEESCDLYLTGERILYSVAYAKLNRLNLVVGSHTFTELFGVRGMLERAGFEGVAVDEIKEEHIEVMGFSRLSGD